MHWTLSRKFNEMVGSESTPVKCLYRLQHYLSSDCLYVSMVISMFYYLIMKAACEVTLLNEWPYLISCL